MGAPPNDAIRRMRAGKCVIAPRSVSFFLGISFLLARVCVSLASRLGLSVFPLRVSVLVSASVSVSRCFALLLAATAMGGAGMNRLR